MEKEYNDMVGKSLKTAFSRMGGDVAGPGGSMDYDQVEKSKSLNSLIKSVTEEDELDGGNADDLTIEKLAKKHKTKVENIINQLIKGIEVEKEHTNEVNLAMEIAMDHLSEDPKYYDKLEKIESHKEESKEATGAASAGAYVGPLFGPMKKERKSDTKPKGGIVDENKGYSKFLKSDENPKGETDGLTPEVLQKIFSKIVQSIKDEDSELPRKEETKEATTSASVGAYDAPFGGPKKDPLKLSNPKTVDRELRSVRDKNFPKFGGPGGKYVRIKDKCKKFPYCNQGDINALELFEKDMVKEAIENISLRLDLPMIAVKSIVLHELEEKLIKEQDDNFETVTFEFPDDYKPKSAEEHRKEFIDEVPDKKAQLLLKKFDNYKFDFNGRDLSGKGTITGIGPVGNVGFLSSADGYKFNQYGEVEIHVELDDLNYKGQKVPIGFYDMISRYLPPEDEEDSYRGDPVESAVLTGLDGLNDVLKYTGLRLRTIRINPYGHLRG
jgi:hypothetical protein